VKILRHRKRRFHYGAHDEPVTIPEKRFEIEFFNTLLDTHLMSIQEKFEQLDQDANTWCFPYNICELPKKEEPIKQCSGLQLVLTVGLDAGNRRNSSL
jgi:hypothetical protein